MTEQKKSDSQLATAEKIAPNGKKSANALEKSANDAHELSQDELEAISGGTCCGDTYSDPDPDPPKSCGAIQKGARRYVCSKYII